ncbi:MAG: phage terminase large subunit, partial [Terriglobales bacterium]
SFDQVIVSVDASFKGNKDSDLVAMQVWGFAGVNSYLCDRRTQRLDYAQTKHALRALIEKWAILGHPISAVLCEDKANGPAIISEMSSEFPLIPINPGADSKVSRTLAVAPQVEAGTVFIPEGADFDELIDLLAKFPRARHDDDCDALSQALTWRRKRQHGLLALWAQEIAAASQPSPGERPEPTAPQSASQHQAEEQRFADAAREEALAYVQAVTKQAWRAIRRP